MRAPSLRQQPSLARSRSHGVWQGRSIRLRHRQTSMASADRPPRRAWRSKFHRGLEHPSSESPRTTLRRSPSRDPGRRHRNGRAPHRECRDRTPHRLRCCPSLAPASQDERSAGTEDLRSSRSRPPTCSRSSPASGRRRRAARRAPTSSSAASRRPATRPSSPSR